MDYYTVIGVALVLYFIPTLITSTNHRNSGSIFIMNLLLGWTIVGWFRAFVWALSKDTK